jgi:hypothetical protein
MCCSAVLNLDTRGRQQAMRRMRKWRLVLSFMPLLCYERENSPRYQGTIPEDHGVEKIMFLRNGARPVSLPPSVSRLSWQCEILNISHPYRPPRVYYGDSFILPTVQDAGWARIRMLCTRLPCSYQELNPDSSIVLQVAWSLYRLSYSGFYLRFVLCGKMNVKDLRWHKTPAS